MGVRLPSEYQEVEYIESTARGQAIAIRDVSRLEFDVSITTDVYWKNVTSRQLHGADTRRYFGVVNGYYQVNQTGTTHTDLVAVINQWQHVSFSRSGSLCTLKVDNDERKVTSAAAASAPTEFRLFGIGQTVSYNCLCRLKQTLVIIEDDRYDLIPCYRKSDSKTGMYDLVSGTFFTNAGTGEFTVGPDVIDSISPLMVAWRRMLMKEPEKWTYILRAEADGRVEKARIPVTGGMHIHMEWDTSRLRNSGSQNDTIFSFFGQASAISQLNPVPTSPTGGYPICSIVFSNAIYIGGVVDLDIPDSCHDMYVGCWNESEYNGSTDRRIFGDYIKIRII